MVFIRLKRIWNPDRNQSKATGRKAYYLSYRTDKKKISKKGKSYFVIKEIYIGNLNLKNVQKAFEKVPEEFRTDTRFTEKKEILPEDLYNNYVKKQRNPIQSR